MSKKKSLEIPLASIDDLFSTQQQREDNGREKIVDLRLDEISDFPNHPFHVSMDNEMERLVESIKLNGVLVPALVRPKESGGYEMIAGHRRRYASELAEKTEIPCIVRNLSDEEYYKVDRHCDYYRELLKTNFIKETNLDDGTQLYQLNLCMPTYSNVLN